jgi:cytochrome c
MLWRMALVAVLAITIGRPALSQDQPPSSAEAKRIVALVNKAAALVDAKGKAALSGFATEIEHVH